MSKRPLSDYITEEKSKPLRSFIEDDDNVKQREAITPGEGATSNLQEERKRSAP